MKKIKNFSFKYENPLLPEDVKTQKQAGKFIRQQLAFIELAKERRRTIPWIIIP
jgi:hypothetical protein